MNGTGNSSIQDSWIGNVAIDPTKGKGASTSRNPVENLHGVMQHRFLKGDGQSAPREVVKRENIGGFNFSDFNKPETGDKKFGKRIYLDDNSKKTSDRKTGTKKLPVPGSRSGCNIGPTSGQGMDLLYWSSGNQKQTVVGNGYTVYK